MKKKLLIFLVILGCNKSSNSLQDLEKLNLSYAQSLKFPIENFDIIVFKPYIYECGNMSEEEINSFYNPDLLQKPFADKIKLITNKKMVYELAINDLKNIKENKVLYVSIEGEVINSKEVVIKENYEFNDGSKSQYFILSKHMLFKNGNWECSVDKK